MIWTIIFHVSWDAKRPAGQYICDALTIIETAKMQHQNVYDIAIAAFRK